ncbi:MAG: hypothetical protein WC310_05840 [Patescibacteria group bacterium]|jgi:hypothetical protein
MEFSTGQTYITKTGHLLTIKSIFGEVVHFYSRTLKTGCFDRSGTYFMINSAFAQTLKLIDQ